ncbi:hypothetical protein [Saccharopolyspora mangrovi]|uniref:Transcriptional regulator n=1 Tax=Saccharopolyspora mangrovi TaxID=3082379 RepID=A0ABU6A995_9PSEU|nr:hypothetical protein [Saccharopolyspora sp. S2-29]MEB3368110.1 hypothetical protein [Saccharopolyspora sp. S2-29]
MRTNIDRPQFLPAPDSRTPLPRHGALPRDEAELLLGTTGLAEALESGEWVQLWRGVVLPAELVRDPMARAAAALLRAGDQGVISGPTAVAMHGCGPVEDAVHVTVPYDRELRSQDDLIVHHAWLRESEVIELDGLRVQALDVALADVLCTGPQRWALDCLERALGRLGSGAEHFRALVGERLVRRRDRRGTRKAFALLELAWVRPGGFAGAMP